MKHLVIEGCTVTVTGEREADLAKRIRKLEVKPVRRWRVAARHRLQNLEVEVEGPGMASHAAVADALRFWRANLPWAINDTKPYPIHIRGVVELF